MHAYNGRFCLTFDACTSQNKIGFLTLTARYIDLEWNLNKRLGLSPETVEALVCLRDWALADTRRHEVVREEELVDAMEKLKLSRPD